MIEVFRRKKRLFLVFEFVDHTVLDELERYPNGLDENAVRKVLWQVLRAIEFCHNHNVSHSTVSLFCNLLNAIVFIRKLYFVDRLVIVFSDFI